MVNAEPGRASNSRNVKPWGVVSLMNTTLKTIMFSDLHGGVW